MASKRRFLCVRCKSIFNLYLSNFNVTQALKVKKKIKDMAQKLEKSEEKMEVDEENCGEEEKQHFVRRLEHLAEGYVDDASEKSVYMTYEEILEYMKKKISEYSKNPEINPNVLVKKQVLKLVEKVKKLTEEIQEVQESVVDVHVDQIKFVQHVGKKSNGVDVGVSVDLPILPNEVPLTASHSENEKTVPTKDSAEAKKLSPLVGPSTSSDSVLKSSANPDLKSNSKIECIDLTDDTSLPSSSNATADVPQTAAAFNIPKKNLPELPPKPCLKVSSDGQRIVLQWDMPSNTHVHAKVISYEVLAYQDQEQATNNPPAWRKIGSVKALSLPMVFAVTLSPFFFKKQNNEWCPTFQYE
ncbi:hypothetical protein TNIN_364281 [Trichonephila inaurata madagascariensis]|uniref:Activating transcription factor 7-interacting protein Fn3 domain-containing protein n=1 Tax=Trichonephila inaurata madagascariensis TaxID=2747483 RepID=A0A8X7C815_9ARAC|nr:hypothetical protein TNIN_364281 [Trichonephila inaurata madagascariensis]